MNMNKEEFLVALAKEGLLIYGTTWLENFNRLKELKKYKEMWEEFKKIYGSNVTVIDDRYWSIDDRMDVIKQRYFPEPEDDIIEIISMVTGVRFDVTEFWKELSDYQRELFKKCFVKEE